MSIYIYVYNDNNYSSRLLNLAGDLVSTLKDLYLSNLMYSIFCTFLIFNQFEAVLLLTTSSVSVVVSTCVEMHSLCFLVLQTVGLSPAVCESEGVYVLQRITSALWYFDHHNRRQCSAQKSVCPDRSTLS